jgi:hypothetical protein
MIVFIVLIREVLYRETFAGNAPPFVSAWEFEDGLAEKKNTALCLIPISFFLGD